MDVVVQIPQPPPTAVAHLCQMPGGMHFYAAGECIFCGTKDTAPKKS